MSEENNMSDEEFKKEPDIKTDKLSVGKEEAPANNGNDGLTRTMINTVFEWGNTLIAALIVLVLLMTFAFRQVTVDGVSMMDTLQDNDRLIITDIFYTPSAGDIVVISHAENYDKPLIKRIIATAGQTLSIDFETGEVVVDGVLLDETYAKGITQAVSRNPMEIPSVIPEGYVFVMGDNREHSLDSRSSDIGLIAVDDIIGKAVLRIYPFSSFGLLS